MGRYLFSKKEDVERLLAIANKSRPTDIKNRGVKRQPSIATGWLFKTLTDGIPAATDDAPGTAKCVPYALVPDNYDEDPKFKEIKQNDGSEMEVDVYNVFTSSIGGDVWITAKRITGYLVADAEDCGLGQATQYSEEGGGSTALGYGGVTL